MTAPLLEVRALEVSYGPLQVLFGVDLEVYRGEIVAIIGPNGAGKSTLIKAVVGLLRVERGTVRFESKDITHCPAHKIPALGIGYVPQGRIVFASLSVEENLEMGAFLLRARAERRRAIESVYAQFPRLAERRRQRAGSLSGGEQQMLAIARALILDPKLLILDEPSLGLSPKYVELVFEKLAELKRAGRTLLMVEQNAARALAAADRGYALELGRNRFTDTGRNLLANEDVRRLYLGAAARGRPHAV
jgi:ABC-type branched-subunit amino acid transport system ATPase component